MKKLKIDSISLIIATLFMLTALLVKHETISMICWILSFVVGGRAKAVEGIATTIKYKSLNVELLMIISAIAAFCIGHYQEGAVLIIIFALSGILEDYAISKSTKSLESLLTMMPETAIKIVDGKAIEIHVKDLKTGVIVEVKAGEQIPADGIVFRGQTYLNESAMTRHLVTYT